MFFCSLRGFVFDLKKQNRFQGKLILLWFKTISFVILFPLLSFQLSKLLWGWNSSGAANALECVTRSSSAEPSDAAQRNQSLSPQLPFRSMSAASLRTGPPRLLAKAFLCSSISHETFPAESVGSVAKHSTAEVRAGEVSISAWFCGQQLGLLYYIWEKYQCNRTQRLSVLTMCDHRALRLFRKPLRTRCATWGWPKKSLPSCDVCATATCLKAVLWGTWSLLRKQGGKFILGHGVH